VRDAFWFGLYNVLLHVGSLLSLPVWLALRFARGRYKGQFRERMGLLDPSVVEAFAGGPGAIWVHAASAGESTSAAPLVRALRRRLPGRPVLFTVTSRYGKRRAAALLGGDVDAVCFSPLDLPLFNARFLNRIRPALYVMVETDFWPNLVRQARRRGARAALASGHAGPRSAPRGFWRAAFRPVELFLMQSETDARHIERRGAPPERVRVMGNLKFDAVDGRLDGAAAGAWRAELGLPPGVPVLVAGSTHPEDEGPVLDAVAAVRRDGIDLHAVVAPRREERVEPVVAACAARDLACARRTAGGRAPVLVLDTMGELARTYSVADVAYVGGGLTPDVGLHSLLEPLVAGAPVVFGPHFGKARRIASEVRAAGAGVEVGGGEALQEALARLLHGGAEVEGMRRAGQAVLDRHRGAAEEQAEAIAGLLS